VSEDRSTGYVVTLAQALTATSGLILALLWALLDKETLNVLSGYAFALRAGAVSLGLAACFSLLTIQYVIAERIKVEKGEKDGPVADENKVRAVFLVGWVSFLVGCGFLIKLLWVIS